jgi:hypothetical protein
MDDEYKLKPYMVSGGFPEEGACLVFAHKVQEAKSVGWPIVSCWGCDSYIEVRATFLKDSSWLYDEANQDKLKAGVSHAIESPIACKGCEKWGYELNEKGYCECCEEEAK